MVSIRREFPDGPYNEAKEHAQNLGLTVWEYVITAVQEKNSRHRATKKHKIF